MQAAMTSGKRMVKSICCLNVPSPMHESGRDSLAMLTLKTSKIESSPCASLGNVTAKNSGTRVATW